jgi:biopolymer transport protein TolR
VSGVRKRKLMAEINVVPYIDVMLVLLIIFMVTAPLLTQGIEVELPKAAAEAIASTEGPEPLVLSIDAAGNLYLSVGENEDEPVEPFRILQLAGTVLERKPETPVLVNADFRATHGQVVAAMVLLQKAGAEKIGFLTDPSQLESLEGLEGSG